MSGIPELLLRANPRLENIDNVTGFVLDISRTFGVTYVNLHLVSDDVISDDDNPHEIEIELDSNGHSIDDLEALYDATLEYYLTRFRNKLEIIILSNITPAQLELLNIQTALKNLSLSNLNLVETDVYHRFCDLLHSKHSLEDLTITNIYLADKIFEDFIGMLANTNILRFNVCILHAGDKKKTVNKHPSLKQIVLAVFPNTLKFVGMRLCNFLQVYRETSPMVKSASKRGGRC
jgi:hypothetical protein